MASKVEKTENTSSAFSKALGNTVIFVAKNFLKSVVTAGTVAALPLEVTVKGIAFSAGICAYPFMKFATYSEENRNLKIAAWVAGELVFSPVIVTAGFALAVAHSVEKGAFSTNVGVYLLKKIDDAFKSKEV